MHVEDFEVYRVFEFLSSRGLVGSVLYDGAFVEDIVKEFYCNLSLLCDDPRSPKYHKAFLCERVFNFSPELIREAWGLEDVEEDFNDDNLNMDEVMTVVTGGKITTWTTKVKIVNLTSLCTVLHKITTTN